MLSSEYLHNISKPLVDIYSQIENDLIANVVKEFNINKNIDIALINDWQANRLGNIEAVFGRNIEILASKTDAINKELDEILTKAGYGTVEKSEYKYALAGFESVAPVTSSTALSNIFNAIKANATNEFNLTNTTLLNNANQKYLDILNTVTSEVLAGTQTYRQAVKQTTREFAKQGLTAFNYVRKDGVQVNLNAYSAVQANIRTTSNNIAKEMVFARNTEYGNDFIEISSHATARPLCAEDQGKVYDQNNGGVREIAGVTIYNFDSTSFGLPAGLFGINCTHTASPFFPGFSEQSPMVKDDPAKYEATQKQRTLENEIRKYKTQKQTALAIGDKEGVQAFQTAISSKQAELRTLTEEAGITRRYDREQV